MANDNQTKTTYRVTVTVAPAEPGATKAVIDAFYFTDPAAIGTIDQSAGTIAVTVPYGTDLRRLAPVICYTGKEIVGIPGANPLRDGARSFTDTVDYTVKAYANETTKTYRVTVTAARNTAKEITAFSFAEVNGANTIISAMPNANGNYPIQITVPDSTNTTSLTPLITHTGASIAGPTTTTNFSPTAPVNYTVTAADGSQKTYAVTVRHANDDDDTIEITGFYFTAPLAAGTINDAANTITVIVPTKTNTASLVPTVYFKGMSVSPGSGAANNFSGPVVYTVKGVNGKTRPYTVTVLKTPSSSKDITRFDFPGITGSETVIGAVPGPDGSYPVSIMVPTGTVLDNRSPSITYTGVSIGPAADTPLNFNNPQTYTVTAEDGSTKTYTVKTIPISGDAKLITSFVFNEVPLAGGGTVRVPAAVDQDGHAITATVPYAANITGLKPTITYIGKFIAAPGGVDKTDNPFIDDTARDFSSSQTYTVKDQNGAGQPYTVTVTKQIPITVSFTGEKENEVIASSAFDQEQGTVTVTANNTASVGPPYEWYVDGVKQAVSEATFTLNVGSGNFTPGRHEILLSGKALDGLHYTGKVSFTVAGGSQ
jgi:hypothetical protein